MVSANDALNKDKKVERELTPVATSTMDSNRIKSKQSIDVFVLIIRKASRSEGGDKARSILFWERFRS